MVLTCQKESAPLKGFKSCRILLLRLLLLYLFFPTFFQIVFYWFYHFTILISLSI